MKNAPLNERKAQILDLISAFCAQKLNVEYFELCMKLQRELSENGSNQLDTRTAQDWAAGIVHAIGSLNFLFDKASPYYLADDEMNEAFGTDAETVSYLSLQIRHEMGFQPFDPNYSIHDILDSDSLEQLVMVDGSLISLDQLPDEYRSMVHEARAEGSDLVFEIER